MYCALTIFRTNYSSHNLIMSGNGDVCADDGPNNREKSRGSGRIGE